jgi:small subunit ribosomal protein S9
MILEPVNISSITKEIASKSDISINVNGGGSSGQAQAARSALAKVITKAASSDVVRKMYMDYDRNLLVDDVRQVEPKKYKGPKARARFQKSYR